MFGDNFEKEIEIKEVKVLLEGATPPIDAS